MANRRWTQADLVSLREKRPEMFDPVAISQPTPQQPSKPKYRNKVTEYNGRKYSSKLEAQMAQYLDLEWKAGNILWYTTQVPFVLEGGVTYRADFMVVRGPCARANASVALAELQVIDSTGVMTQTKFNKLKQMEARYGIVVMIHRKGGGLVPYHQVPVHRRRAFSPVP